MPGLFRANIHGDAEAPAGGVAEEHAGAFALLRL